MSDFDVDEFSEQVFQEFEVLKATKLAKFPSEAMKEVSRHELLGCVFIPIASIIDRFAKRALDKEKRKRRYFENERYAETLLLNYEIKVSICKSLEVLPRKEILTEEKFVKTLTETLVEGNSQRKFTIPFEPILFAAVAYKVFETGAENFCQNLSDEQ